MLSSRNTDLFELLHGLQQINRLVALAHRKRRKGRPRAIVYRAAIYRAERGTLRRTDRLR